jgi:hypothetical protein
MERLRLRRKALELIAKSIDATDAEESLRLSVEAQALIAKADREYGAEPLPDEPIRQSRSGALDLLVDERDDIVE